MNRQYEGEREGLELKTKHDKKDRGKGSHGAQDEHDLTRSEAIVAIRQPPIASPTQ